VKTQTSAFVHNCSGWSSRCCTLPFLSSVQCPQMWLAVQCNKWWKNATFRFNASLL